MNIVLLGPPGAGKGTQAKRIAQKLQIAHISTGDILRQNVAKDTRLGLQAKDYMNKGALVPDELVSNMVEDRLSQPDIKRGFILDGYPRNINQAETLDKFLGRILSKIDFVIYLDSTEPVIIQRICGRLVCKSCGANFHKTNMPPVKEGICDNCSGELYQRSDDKEETVRKRLEVYQKESAPLIEYYRKNSNFSTINADEEAQSVLDKIINLVQASDGSLKI